MLCLFRLHEGVFRVIPEISVDFTWFSSINPNPAFLSDVAAFEAVIIALLVPLSIEIVSRISERYNSDVITRVFESRWENKYLPLFLLVSIVLAVLLRFLVSDGTDSLAWKIFAWIVLLVFAIIAFTIWRIITRIKVFMSDTQSVVDQLYQDVQKALE